MRIACEKCNAVYSIAEKIIGPSGRIVKCAKCDHTWTVSASLETAPIPNLIKSNTSKPTKNSHLKLIIISSSFLLTILAFLIFSKDLIRYKALTSLYEKFSIHDASGIKLNDFTFKTENQDVIIKGALVNESNEDRKMPQMRYVLLDKDKKVIFRFTTYPAEGNLKPGERIIINSKINNVTRPAKHLQIDIGNKLDLLFR